MVRAEEYGGSWSYTFFMNGDDLKKAMYRECPPELMDMIQFVGECASEGGTPFELMRRIYDRSGNEDISNEELLA